MPVCLAFIRILLMAVPHPWVRTALTVNYAPWGIAARIGRTVDRQRVAAYVDRRNANPSSRLAVYCGSDPKKK